MSEPSWLGIDLGGTFIKWELVGNDGATIESGKTPTPRTGQLAVTDTIIALVRALAVGDDAPAAVGIAVPGHLAEGRESITLLPNVPGEWIGFPVRSVIVEATGLDVALLNDARAFALAELELGAAAGASDAVFATIGTGIGGAIAVDGRVVSSPRDNFGEIGHTTAVVDGERCGCGSLGCVEAYAGGSYVLARARQRDLEIEPGPGALLSLVAAAQTDPKAAAVLEEAYDAFAVGVSSICAYSGSRLVVVGGAVATELPGYLARSRQRLEQRTVLLGSVEVRPGVLGARAGALGAALAARRAALTQTFSSDTTSPHTTSPHTEREQPELEHTR